MRTPGGHGILPNRFWISEETAPNGAPTGLAPTVTTSSRSRWSISAGPSVVLMVATCPSGIVVSCPRFVPNGSDIPGASTSGSCSRSAAFVRNSGASRTVTSRVLPVGSTQSPAWTPANAGRSDCATCPTVTPSVPASPRLRSTSSSGRCPLLESPTSAAPGTLSTTGSSRSANRVDLGQVVAADIRQDLLPVVAEPVREHPGRDPRDALHLVAHEVGDLVLALSSLRLGNAAGRRGPPRPRRPTPPRLRPSSTCTPLPCATARCAPAPPA